MSRFQGRLILNPSESHMIAWDSEGSRVVSYRKGIDGEVIADV